ncbi:GntP family permease [Clostridiales bacterium COT073_COT-073]|nr:GntP family permease [Clostridiales bacterium COT073_COT-073]
MGILGIIGLIIGIVLLIVLAYRGVHMLVTGLLAGLVVILTNGVNIWDTLVTGADGSSFSKNMTGFIGAYFIMFMLGAILGEFMSKSNYAKTIAVKLVDIFGVKNSVLVVLLATILVAYGGVSVFVIVFAIYPIGLYVFKQANISKNLMPATILLGAGTFVMTCLPGSPALTNVVPTSYLGTTTWAAPILGTILGIFMFILGYAYLLWEAKRLREAGIGFEAGPNDVVEEITAESKKDLPNFFLAIVPVILIFVVQLIGTKNGLNANYAVCLGMLTATLFIVFTAWNRIEKKLESVNKGTTGSIGALMNTASIVGFGGVVKAVPAFSAFTNFALALPFAPIISATTATAIIAAITTSSSGGLTMFLNMMAEGYLAKGVDPEILHRLCAVAAGTFDSLPHAGPNVTILMVMGLTYKKAYKYMFVITCIIPTLATILGIILASLGIK